MLVLTRRVGEEIVLPGLDVRVVVLAVRGQRIRLGVDSPEAIEILRGELCLNRAEIEHPVIDPSSRSRDHDAHDD